MNFSQNGINYIQYGKGEDVILLHGWGQNIEMMKPLGDNLINKRITIIDFPGFGRSEEPKNSWTIENYCEELHNLVKELKIKNPILVGHSFGGRVAIKYSSKYDVKKLVLFGSPCIRVKHNEKKEKILKSIKKLPFMNSLGEYMKKYIGSDDYKNASKVMRETLVNVVNEDLSEDAKKIKIPTLLIWGNKDDAAPIEYARQLENILEDGALIELDGATHYAYLERLNYVSNILNNFMEDK